MAGILYKITYKNHCTPQENVDFDDGTTRWYLDSDVGARLTGTALMNFGAVQPTYDTGTLTGVQTVALSLTGNDFYYFKNTGATGSGTISISLADEDDDGSQSDAYQILLAPGECFASKVATFSSFIIKSSATTTYEYIIAT